MKLTIDRAGALTTVQDLGRWGSQALGMPVSGAMDAPALMRGNILLGNPEGAAAIEMTLLGAAVTFHGEGAIVLTGGDLSPKINGRDVPMWTVLAVAPGDKLSYGAPCPGKGCRSYLCVAGGIDVPEVMGSRSTYMKAKIGGLEGRPLKTGDELETGTPYILWRDLIGLSCPEEYRTVTSPDEPLRAVPGLQDSYIKPEGIDAFFTSEYTVSGAADRMGYRLEGGKTIEHKNGPDIISDGIPMGAIQVPGQGQPIVMMADRQTTGGYVKLGVVLALDVARLAQKMPGEKLSFRKITQEEGIGFAKAEAANVEALRNYVCGYVSRPSAVQHTSSAAGENAAASAMSGAMNLTLNGRTYAVSWEKLD